MQQDLPELESPGRNTWLARSRERLALGCFPCQNAESNDLPTLSLSPLPSSSGESPETALPVQAAGQTDTEAEEALGLGRGRAEFESWFCCGVLGKSLSPLWSSVSPSVT